VKRTLRLSRETLRELTPEQLGEVVGAGPSNPTCPLLECVNSHYIPCTV
jgi:hypothetical protein